MIYTIFKFLCAFWLMALGLFSVAAQENDSFKTTVLKAWALHAQKQYERATPLYVTAFQNYQSIPLQNKVLPAYEKLSKQLASIFKKDQAIRKKYLKKNYPVGSKKRAILINEMTAIDAANLTEVKAILNEYGWLGPHEVGYFGNKAFFFTLQHANLEEQKHFFETTVEAVAKGYVEPYQLAYLIDRISLREKRLLIFGSECRQYSDSKTYYVAPTFGIAGLDERRALVALEPMAVYVTKYGLIWNAEAYEVSLPALMDKIGY